LRDKVNDATFWGLDARCVKLSQWKWSKQYYGTCTGYIVNVLEFEINVGKWNFRRIDQGFRIKNGVDDDGRTKYLKLMDGKDQPLQKPRLLDGAGGLLAAADPPEILDSKVIHEADFSDLITLGIPTTV